jgi:hypothetical protein
MRKSLFIAVMVTVFHLTSNAMCKVALPLNISLSDSVHKKIVHPKISMSDAQLTIILNRMRQKRNDAEKIVVLKTDIKDKGITVAQLTQLLNQFLTDDSKLSCAEFAYQYTVDYKGYLDLQNLFQTEEPKGKLEDFIKENK